VSGRVLANMHSENVGGRGGGGRRDYREVWHLSSRAESPGQLRCLSGIVQQHDHHRGCTIFRTESHPSLM